jgi:hypothetical protein
MAQGLDSVAYGSPVASPVAPHTSTPAELKARLEAERAGHPFLLYRDGDRRQHICVLEPGSGPFAIGRRAQNDIALAWDPEVSRLHATVECVGGNWTIEDDGLSSNGSFLNGERIAGRHRLEHGDLVLIGTTALLFCEPGANVDESTVPAGAAPTRADLSETQRHVLTALCRPFRGNAPFAVPATNEAIAAELVVSPDTVKGNLRKLFQKFGIEDLPQNQKRARLVALAMQSGLVGEPDFDGRR